MKSKKTLGARLREKRKKIVESGKKLLDEEGVRKELQSRRGGLPEN